MQGQPLGPSRHQRTAERCRLEPLALRGRFYGGGSCLHAPSAALLTDSAHKALSYSYGHCTDEETEAQGAELVLLYHTRPRTTRGPTLRKGGGEGRRGVAANGQVAVGGGPGSPG